MKKKKKTSGVVVGENTCGIAKLHTNVSNNALKALALHKTMQSFILPHW